MTNFNSPFLNELYQRGFIYQCSNLEALDDVLTHNKVKAYIGFDCTADSLHIGSLIQLMMFRWLQKYGHTPVVLLGGGTTLIGDPSGKDSSRPLLSEEIIASNQRSIKKVISNFINTATSVFIDNAEWLTKFNYLNFLRNYGQLFTINRMLTLDSVKLRLDRQQPLTFLEFNYMILQSIDYLHLFENHDVTLQLGGSDQWGNIINGVDLIRRVTGKEAFALTSPLITNSDGSKMGKTANGAIWLSEDKISSWDYYQYWRNVEDTAVIRYLKLFTELPLSEIAQFETLQGKELNEAKKVLAFEATSLCFGQNAALQNAKAATEVFEEGALSTNLPVINISQADFTHHNTVIELVTFLQITGSKSEARKLIINKGLKINNELITTPLAALTSYIDQDQQLKISVGKKKHYLISITQ